MNPRLDSSPAAEERRPAALRSQLGSDHVLAVLMDEHQHLLDRLDRLDELVNMELETLTLTQRRASLEEVVALARALIAAEPHHRREEEVLFPTLEQLGIHGPPTVMRAEHATLRHSKQRLEQEALAALRRSGQGWTETMRTARTLTQLLREHIRKEDEVLYPTAHERLTDPESWAQMQRRCDAIGYCCSAHG
jgi:hypothetical protein